VFVEVVAQLSKCRRQTGWWRALRCLQKESDEEGQGLHARSV
jgi:hypothetical protein